MIKCKYCNAENQVDDLFCNKCGRDLKKTINVPVKRKLFSPAKILRRFIFLLFLCFLAYAVYVIVYPSVFPDYTMPIMNNNESLAAEKQLRSLEFKKKSSYVFTTDELTYLVNNYLIDKEIRTKPIYISLKNNKNLCFTVMIKLFDFINLKTPLTVVTVPEYEFENMNRFVTGFMITEIFIGKQVLPKSMYNKCMKYFDGYINERIKKILKTIFDIKINDNGKIMFIQQSGNNFSNM